MAQGGDITGGTMPEPEVLPDHHHPGIQGNDEALDEILRAHPCHLLVEPHDPHLMRSGGLEQVDPLFEPGDQFRGRLGTQHRQGMRPEGDDSEFTITTLGLQDTLMTTVNTIEVADGHDAGSTIHGPYVSRVEPDVHPGQRAPPGAMRTGRRVLQSRQPSSSTT